MAKRAVLLLAHGTPNVVEEIPEYLRNVVSGRPLPQAAPFTASEEPCDQAGYPEAQGETQRLLERERKAAALFLWIARGLTQPHRLARLLPGELRLPRQVPDQ